MDKSASTTSDSVEDGGALPESWEVADVEASVRRLMLSSEKVTSLGLGNISLKQPEIAEGSGVVSGSESDDLITSVDQFLREAIQNPRERLSILRMEQDIEKFIRDPTRDQMEFQQLPTSYLRLAAHRIAQHYSLQSMVLLDNNLLDGSSSRIIIRKTSALRLPLIRLADIPVNLPTEDIGTVKVAIKQRPQKGSHTISGSNPQSSKSSGSKSMEERKEEYNKARARIFSSSSFSGSCSGKAESEQKSRDNFQSGSLGIKKAEDKLFSIGGPHVNISRSSSDSSVVSSRLTGSMPEREPIGRSNTNNNRVAIFRDREVDLKDPDYDRRRERYMQRFDPGFGFSGSPFTVQPMYAPALNYNTEFPQLGSGHNPSISSELQPRPVPQHLPRPWAPPSAPTGLGYSPLDPLYSPFSPSQVNTHTNSGPYLHSPQYPCPRSGLPYIHPLEQLHKSFSQSHQQQSDANYGLARPR